MQLDKFTLKSQEAIQTAQQLAQKSSNQEIHPCHLAKAILEQPDGVVVPVLKKIGPPPSLILMELNRLIEQLPKVSGSGAGQIYASPELSRILDKSLTAAQQMQDDFVSQEHLFLAIIRDTNNPSSKILHGKGVTEKNFMQSLSEIRGSHRVTHQYPEEKYQALKKYGRNLTDSAKQAKLAPVIGRDEEIRRVIQVLSRRNKNNPILIGEPGVGKTAIVEGLAQRIVNGDIPATLVGKQVITLDLGALVAGAKYRGEFEDRLKAVLKEVIEQAGEIILFIDEIHTLVGTGAAEGSMDASNMLKPALARGELHCIGATTIDEYRKYIEKDSALKKEKDEATREWSSEITKKLANLNDRLNGMKGQWTLERDTIQGIRKIKESIDQAHAEEQQAERAGEFSKVAEIRYGRIIQMKKDLAQATGRLQEIQATYKMLKEEVTAEDVASVVAKWTGIPVDRLLEGEVDKLIHAETILNRRVIGQEAAIKAMANAVRRGRAGLQDPDRPLGSFIFLGPTGVGKTELARTLADFLFDSEQAKIRIDMSEFMEKHSVARLIGAPPGYVGYEEGGYLTEAVHRRPYSVILLDEIEKAHPDVFNVLLQVLDDGRMTDGKGRTVDFKNTILIMTSNIGSDLIFNMTEDNEGTETISRLIAEILRLKFKPEFLNRIDETIIFSSLSKTHMLAIVDIQLQRVLERIAERKIKVQISQEAKRFLVDSGYNPQFGARPLKRAIQRYLEDPLAMELLAGHFSAGDLILVDSTDGKLTFTAA